MRQAAFYKFLLNQNAAQYLETEKLKQKFFVSVAYLVDKCLISAQISKLIGGLLQVLGSFWAWLFKSQVIVEIVGISPII